MIRHLSVVMHHYMQEVLAAHHEGNYWVVVAECDLKISHNPQTEFFPGCWRDSTDPAQYVLVSLENPNPPSPYLVGDYLKRQNPVKSCFGEALRLGYSVFGMRQKGMSMCVSAADAHQTYQTHQRFIFYTIPDPPPPKGFFSARLLYGFCVLSLQNLCIPLQLFLNPLQKLHLRCLGLGQDGDFLTMFRVEKL